MDKLKLSTYNIFKIITSSHLTCLSFRYYCEINIFVTAVPNEETPHMPLLRPNSVGVAPSNVRPAFTADELYGKLIQFLFITI